MIAGILLGFAWQEWIYGWLGLLGLGIFFLVQLEVKSVWAAAANAVVTGLVGFLISCSWLVYTIGFLANTDGWLSTMLMVSACLFQAGTFLFFALLLYCFPKSPWRILIVPAVWLIASKLFPALYPCEVGGLLVDQLEFCQLAELGGVFLVSYFAATLAMAFPLLCGRLFYRSDSLHSFKQRWISLAIIGVLMIGVYCWGMQRIRQVETRIEHAEISGEGINVFVVQVDTETENAHLRMYQTSRQVSGKADLILWPECALGSYNQRCVQLVTEAESKESAGRDAPHPFPQLASSLIAGADTYRINSEERSKLNFVSALMVNRDQIVGRHDKIVLMPYGEFIPGESIFPQLRKWFGSSRLISRGDQPKPIGEVNGIKIGTLLCCEDMYPELFRQLADQGAQVLVSLGNGMAFDSEIALKQHLRNARLRSVENRSYFIRCTSRGVSALIRPTGEIDAQIPCMEDGAFLARVNAIRFQKTYFTRHGSYVVWVLIFVPIAVVLILHLLARWEKLKSPDRGSPRSSDS